MMLLLMHSCLWASSRVRCVLHREGRVQCTHAFAHLHALGCFAQGMYIPAENRCTRTRDSIPVNCKYSAGDANRSCPVGTYIEKQCNIKEAVYSDFDRSSCKACPKRLCQPWERVKPCTGTMGRDDSVCEPCPNLQAGRCVRYFADFILFLLKPLTVAGALQVPRGGVLFSRVHVHKVCRAARKLLECQHGPC